MPIYATYINDKNGACKGYTKIVIKHFYLTVMFFALFYDSLAYTTRNTIENCGHTIERYDITEFGKLLAL